jgi:glycerol-3-phosphate dehydrogenase
VLPVYHGGAHRATTITAGVQCRAVVNAAGPWVDEVRRMENPRSGPLARLSKGVHVIVEQSEPWEGHHRALRQTPRGIRLPWEGNLLLGTTDTEYGADPAAVSVLPEDVETVLSEASVRLPSDLLAPDRIRYTFAGLRCCRG